MDKSRLIEINPQMIHTSEFVARTLKSLLFVCLMYKRLKNVKWRHRRYKKTQVKFIEMKNILDEINGILVVAEEISECEYTEIKTEKQRKMTKNI